VIANEQHRAHFQILTFETKIRERTAYEFESNAVNLSNPAVRLRVV
jgi:hypothetical protein